MTPRCVNNHLLTDENFYVSPKGRKVCRKCSAASSRRWRSKKSSRIHMRKYLNAWRARRRNKK